MRDKETFSGLTLSFAKAVKVIDGLLPSNGYGGLFTAAVLEGNGLNDVPESVSGAEVLEFIESQVGLRPHSANLQQLASRFSVGFGSGGSSQELAETSHTHAGYVVSEINESIVSAYATSQHDDMNEQAIINRLKDVMHPMCTDIPTQLNCIIDLGAIYFDKAKTGTDKLDFAKATALYNYAINLCKSCKGEIERITGIEISEKINTYRSLLTAIEREFLRSIANRHNITEEVIDEVVSMQSSRIADHKDKLQGIRNGAEDFLNQVIGGKRRQLETIPKEKVDEREVLELDIASENDKLQKSITKSMKSLIAKMIAECQDTSLLGPAPCKFAIVGLGSMARGEITPYSDFEFVILIEDQVEIVKERHKDDGVEETKGSTREDLSRQRQEDIEQALQRQEKAKEYFRGLTYYLQIKILNLGETILPVTDLKLFKSFRDEITPRGFAIDNIDKKDGNGFKWPIGRKDVVNKSGRRLKDFELIGTPDEVARYQVALVGDNDPEKYEPTLHLAEVLSNVVYVPVSDERSSQGLVDRYEAVVNKHHKELLDLKRTRHQVMGLHALKSCLDEFPPIRYGASRVIFDTKNEIDRFPNMALDAIAMWYGLKQGANWERIEELTASIDRAVILSVEAANNLKIALSIAMEMRLRTYLKNKRMREYASVHSSFDKTSYEQVFGAFSITEETLFRYYETVMPLFERIKDFIDNEGINRELLSYEDNLYDDSSEIKGLIYYKLMQIDKAYARLQDIGDKVGRHTRAIWEDCRVIKNNQAITRRLPSDLNEDVPCYSSFVGREAELAQLQEIFDIGITKRAESNVKKLVLISAYGGTGKSTLAAKCLEEAEKHGFVVRWFSANKIQAGYTELARDLGIFTEKEKADFIRRSVRSRLEQENKVLFVFDDIDNDSYETEASTYIRNLPSNVGVIITSRNPKLINVPNIKYITLEPFNESEARQYISNVVNTLEERANHEQVTMLINTIGTITGYEIKILPKRLSLACAALNDNELMTVEQYAAKYQAMKEDGIEHPEIEIVLGKLFEKGEAGFASWKLLQYLSYLDSDFTTAMIFENSTLLTQDELTKGAKILTSLSLVTVTSKEDGNLGFKTHSFIIEETKKYAQAELHTDHSMKTKDIITHLIVALNNYYPISTANKDNWKHAIQTTIIVEILINNLEDYQTLPLDICKHLSSLINKLAQYYNEVVCDSRKYRKYQEQAYAIGNYAYQDTACSEIVDLLFNLGAMYTNTKVSKEEENKALDFIRRAKEVSERLPSTNEEERKIKNKKVAWCLHGLATAIEKIGTVDLVNEGLECAENALNIRLKIFKEDSTHTTCTLNTYACLHLSIGMLNEALKKFQKLLEIRLSLYAKKCTDIKLLLREIDEGRVDDVMQFIPNSGEAFHDIAQCLVNLGKTYQDLKDYERALTYHEASFKMRKILHNNINHYRIAESLLGLGIARAHLGRAHEGTEDCRQSYDIYFNLYGDTHLETIRACRGLSISLHIVGNYREALARAEKSLSCLENIDLKEHPIYKKLLDHRDQIIVAIQKNEPSVRELKDTDDLDVINRSFEIVAVEAAISRDIFQAGDHDDLEAASSVLLQSPTTATQLILPTPVVDVNSGALGGHDESNVIIEEIDSSKRESFIQKCCRCFASNKKSQRAEQGRYL